MAYKSQITAILATDTVVFTMPATLQGAAIVGIGNTTAGAITYTLKYYKQSAGVTTTLFANRSMAANDFKKIEIPFLMETGDQVIIVASGTGLTAFASVPQSASTPAAKGFNPAGNYSGASTYQTNDVVFNVADQTSYLSRIDNNTGNTPSSSPSQWQVFGARGAAGSGDFTGPSSSVADRFVSFNGTTGKIGKDSGVGLGTSGHAVPVFDSSGDWSRPQRIIETALTSATAWDGSVSQRLGANVNGSTFQIANPSVVPSVGVYVTINILFTTSNGVSFGNLFRGLTKYVASAVAGKKDHLLFKSDGTNLDLIAASSDYTT
jgi:hypothetical protein